jgi:hypothetical protein
MQGQLREMDIIDRYSQRFLISMTVFFDFPFVIGMGGSQDGVKAEQQS